MSDDPIQPESRFFSSQGLTLHYLDWGNAGAPPLILLHGGRDHARSWDWVARELRDQYHIVAPDMRGHGESQWSPDGAYAMPYLITDFADFIEELGYEQVSIAAHSYGAAMSLGYTGAFPDRVRRIAAIEGIGLAGKMAEKPFIERLRQFVIGRREMLGKQSRPYPSLAAATERMKSANQHLSEEQARHLTEHGARLGADGHYRWKYDLRFQPFFPVEFYDDDVRALWRLITCPVWLVHGADSWALHPDAQGRSADFKDVQVTSFERAGHWVQHDRFEDFVAGLRTFLA